MRRCIARLKRGSFCVTARVHRLTSPAPPRPATAPGDGGSCVRRGQRQLVGKRVLDEREQLLVHDERWCERALAHKRARAFRTLGDELAQLHVALHRLARAAE